MVWSCGGGNPALDPIAGLRTVTSTLVEQVWAAMTPVLATPRPDDYPSTGPEPRARLDVYIVKRNRCVMRSGVCVPLPPPNPETGQPPLATAYPCAPCEGGGTLPHSSSGFMLIPEDRVPANVPGAGVRPSYGRSSRTRCSISSSTRSDLEAVGNGCGGPLGAGRKEPSAWLVEASAEWASWAFFPNDAPVRRRRQLDRFLTTRDPSVHGLLTLGIRVYQSWVYPFFVQQEDGGAVDRILDLWAFNTEVRTAAGITDLLAARFPFVEHFRDFAVRNVNTDELPGMPIHPLYSDQDPALLPLLDVSPEYVNPVRKIANPVDDEQHPVRLAPLAAQYEKFELADDSIRWMKLDTSDVPHSDLDVLVELPDRVERRRIAGNVFTACRDDAGDDVHTFTAIVSNTDHREGGSIAAAGRLTARKLCPSGWRGEIRLTLTVDQSSHDQDAGMDVRTATQA